MKGYFEKRGVSGMTELDSVWVTDELIEDLTSALSEFCNEEGFAELAMVLPTPFTTRDNAMVLERLEVGERACGEA